MNASKSIIAHLAPTGRLRASINLGNPILANADPQTRQPFGISVDLANALAQRLGVEAEYVVFDAAGKAADALARNEIDAGFLAIDPVRGEGISFTAPYVLIEGCYLVRNESPVVKNEEVDRPGMRVAVGAGSAYDLFLSRELKHAQIVRAPTSPTVVDTFIEQGLEVAAGVRQQLESDAARFGGLRLLAGRFMVIRQAMATPKCRPAEVVEYLRAFVEEMKASGFVAQSLERHAIAGAAVAPLSDE
ncbi:ABC transporter substrate-binding protein [Noviherbaspirillum cavernae]|uniref:ABC transporter substrate-binding protein n=1 Tax=Noviherbaspirillum cavernae TaxID=2320862 RepID=A0A418X318_9BURK|nr:ABC transporter substrate-binding protein [Noviherbaspirillum cavernae]RJG06791.1 ABC transporter substrate-binding protein [Noviherbaspirillum cavernae]